MRVLWLNHGKIISRVQSAQHIRPFYVAIGKQGKEDDSDIVTKLGENEVAIKNQRSLLGGVTDRKSHVHVPCGAEVHYPFPSVREYRMSQLSAEQKDALAAQRRIQKKAFEFISEALELDEGATDLNEKKTAISFYKRGIEELEKGIAIEVHRRGSDIDRAKALRDKMQNNLVMATDRLRVLSSNIKPVDKQPTSEPSNQPVDKQPTSEPSNQPVDKQPASESSNQPAYKQPTSEPSNQPVDKQPTSEPSNQPVDKQPTSEPSNQPVDKQPTSLPQAQPFVPGANKSKTRTSLSTDSNNSDPRPSALAEARPSSSSGAKRPLPTTLKTVNYSLANTILSEVVDSAPSITFDDITGQETSKQALQEIVILPALRPELFTGLRSPARGLLLFGPPGNGKTMLAKAVACESNATFFSISAASLTSKWYGEEEKLVRALFAAAKELQPTVIFIDEIDSLFCARKENEHEASRRLKTQFMIEFQGMKTDGDDQVLVMGATNRPHELDDAILRRFPKRIPVPMPDIETRHTLLESLLSKQDSPLKPAEIAEIARLTDGYSSSDLTALAKDAALGPIRELCRNQIRSVDVGTLRDITFSDFKDSLKRIRQSVPAESLEKLEQWNRQYGDIST